MDHWEYEEHNAPENSTIFMLRLKFLKDMTNKEWCLLAFPWKLYDDVFMAMLQSIRMGDDLLKSIDDAANRYVNDVYVISEIGITPGSKWFSLEKVLAKNVNGF